MEDLSLALILSGIKIAIFLAVLVLAYLIDIVDKKHKNIHGLNIMAISFVLAAIVEFLHSLALTHEGILPWLAMHENLYMITHPLFLIAGLGIIWYLLGINKNIKDYY